MYIPDVAVGDEFPGIFSQTVWEIGASRLVLKSCLTV